MKHCIAITLSLLFIMLCLGNSSSMAFADELTTQQTAYKNDDLGFEIHTDKDWKFSRQDKDSVSFEIGTEEAKGQVMICINTTLTPEELALAGKDIADYGSKVFAEIQKTDSNIKLVNSGKCTIAGTPAYKYTWKTTLTSQDGTKIPAEFMQILMVKDETLCLFQLASTQDVFSSFVDRVLKCFNTFAFTE